MKKYIYISLIMFAFVCTIPACQKSDVRNHELDDARVRIKVALSAPQVKAFNYFVPDTVNVYAFCFADPEETRVSEIAPERIDKDGTHHYSLPAGSDSVVFSNCTIYENWYDKFDNLSCSKDFDTKTLTFNRTADLYSTCDLVAGGASLNDAGDDGIVKVHLNRLTAYLSAVLQFVDADKEELVFTDYIQKAGVAVANQAVSVSCDAKGNVSVSDTSLDTGSVSYRTSSNLCTERPMFPTAQGMNGIVKLYMKHFDGSETVLVKELDYPFERNRHYVLTITVKRSETSFGGFQVEDIVSETIDMPLN